jgi:hypothetical protein
MNVRDPHSLHNAKFSIQEDKPKPKLLDLVRQALRTRHYSKRTETTYLLWIKRYIFFHNKRHPAEMAEPEVNQFLTNLAVKEKGQRINTESSVECVAVSLSFSD